MYALIFKFLDSKLHNKGFCTEWQQAFPDFSLLLISSWIEFWYVKVVSQIFELFHPFKWSIININTVTLSYILISRHDHVLSFISIYF